MFSEAGIPSFLRVTGFSHSPFFNRNLPKELIKMKLNSRVEFHQESKFLKIMTDARVSIE